MYCRNCGKELSGPLELCPSCEVNPISGNRFCQTCGYASTPAAELCNKCGAKLVKLLQPDSLISQKSRLAVSLLTILPACVGINGIHRFYLGKTGTAIAMLLTLGGLGIWTLIDFIMALTGRMKDKQDKPILQW